MGTESGGGYGDGISGALDWLGIDSGNLPLVGSYFGQSSEDKALEQQMKAASAAYQAMRAPAAEASTQAMQNMLGGIAGPGNQMMGDVYGQDAKMDFKKAAQNPLGGGGGGGGVGGPQDIVPTKPKKEDDGWFNTAAQATFPLIWFGGA